MITSYLTIWTATTTTRTTTITITPRSRYFTFLV